MYFENIERTIKHLLRYNSSGQLILSHVAVIEGNHGSPLITIIISLLFNSNLKVMKHNFALTPLLMGAISCLHGQTVLQKKQIIRKLNIVKNSQVAINARRMQLSEQLFWYKIVIDWEKVEAYVLLNFTFNLQPSMFLITSLFILWANYWNDIVYPWLLASLVNIYQEIKIAAVINQSIFYEYLVLLANHLYNRILFWNFI